MVALPLGFCSSIKPCMILAGFSLDPAVATPERSVTSCLAFWTTGPGISEIRVLSINVASWAGISLVSIHSPHCADDLCAQICFTMAGKASSLNMLPFQQNGLMRTLFLEQEYRATELVCEGFALFPFLPAWRPNGPAEKYGNQP